MTDKSTKLELNCLYSLNLNLLQRQEEGKKEIENLKSDLCFYKEAVGHFDVYGVIDDHEKEIEEFKKQLDVCKTLKEGTIKENTLKIHRLQTNYDEVMRDYEDSIRERDNLLTDKRRVESDIEGMKEDYTEIVTECCDLITDKSRLEAALKKNDNIELYLKEVMKDRDRLQARLDGKSKNYKEESNKKERKEVQTQRSTLSKGRLEYILKQYYNSETLKIGSIAVGTRTQTLYPSSSELELDIQYTEKEKKNE